MTYKIDPEVAKITCPIITMIDEKETRYESEKSLTEQMFNKPYLIKEITASNNTIVLVLIENCIVNSTEWSKDQEISFF